MNQSTGGTIWYEKDAQIELSLEGRDSLQR